MKINRCNHVHADRIKRGTIVKKTLFWLPLKRYHCLKCDRKFYQLSRDLSLKTVVTLLLGPGKWGIQLISLHMDGFHLHLFK